MLSRADAVYFKDYSELSMNLAFVIYRYFPHGGLQQDLEKIVCECIARGHKVTVFAGEWQGAEIPYADIEIISPRGLGRCEKIAAFERKTFQQLAQGKFDAVTGFIPMRGLDIYFAGNSISSTALSDLLDIWAGKNFSINKPFFHSSLDTLSISTTLPFSIIIVLA